MPSRDKLTSEQAAKAIFVRGTGIWMFDEAAKSFVPAPGESVTPFSIVNDCVPLEAVLQLASKRLSFTAPPEFVRHPVLTQTPFVRLTGQNGKFGLWLFLDKANPLYVSVFHLYDLLRNQGFMGLS